MPVACAPAREGATTPANTATSTATGRRILVSFPRFAVSVRQVPSRTVIVPHLQNNAARPPGGRAAQRVNESEADDARQDHLARVPDHAAEFGEWLQVALHLERGAGAEVQVHAGVARTERAHRCRGRGDG